MINVISFPFTDEVNTGVAFEIRRKVFVDEQRVSRDEEYDVFEKTSTHYLVSFDDHPVGTARWRFTERGIKLERFAVLKAYRNSGAGTAILNRVMRDVIPLKHLIYLHAQITALNFYLRAGFEISGDEFLEANIRHNLMEWKGSLI
jgi:predicted GNAT family N-acyltransferase